MNTKINEANTIWLVNKSIYYLIIWTIIKTNCIIAFQSLQHVITTAKINLSANYLGGGCDWAILLCGPTITNHHSMTMTTVSDIPGRKIEKTDGASADVHIDDHHSPLLNLRTANNRCEDKIDLWSQLSLSIIIEMGAYDRHKQG